MITGASKILKYTQTYTPAFGQAVASSFAQHSYSGFFDEVVDKSSPPDFTEYVNRHNARDDAELEMVAGTLRDEPEQLLQVPMVSQPPP